MLSIKMTAIVIRRVREFKTPKMIQDIEFRVQRGEILILLLKKTWKIKFMQQKCLYAAFFFFFK